LERATLLNQVEGGRRLGGGYVYLLEVMSDAKAQAALAALHLWIRPHTVECDALWEQHFRSMVLRMHGSEPSARCVLLWWWAYGVWRVVCGAAAGRQLWRFVVQGLPLRGRKCGCPRDSVVGARRTLFGVARSAHKGPNCRRAGRSDRWHYRSHSTETEFAPSHAGRAACRWTRGNRSTCG
jgi:hypothetical protein